MMERFEQLDGWAQARASDTLLWWTRITETHSDVLVNACVIVSGGSLVIVAGLIRQYAVVGTALFLVLFLTRRRPVAINPALAVLIHLTITVVGITQVVQFMSELLQSRPEWTTLLYAIGLFGYPISEYLSRVPPIDPPLRERRVTAASRA